MRFIGLILGILVGIVVLYFSKWMILADLLLIPFVMSFFIPAKFKCPECGNIQKSAIVISEDSDTQLTHGRHTKSGSLDKRYNSTFSTTNYVTYGVECQNCDSTFKVTRIN